MVTTCLEAVRANPAPVQLTAQSNCATVDASGVTGPALQTACNIMLTENSLALHYPGCTGDVKAADVYDAVCGACATVCGPHQNCIPTAAPVVSTSPTPSPVVAASTTSPTPSPLLQSQTSTSPTPSPLLQSQSPPAPATSVQTCLGAVKADPNKVKVAFEYACETSKTNNLSGQALIDSCEEIIPELSWSALYEGCTGDIKTVDVYDAIGGVCSDVCYPTAPPTPAPVAQITCKDAVITDTSKVKNNFEHVCTQQKANNVTGQLLIDACEAMISELSFSVLYLGCIGDVKTQDVYDAVGGMCSDACSPSTLAPTSAPTAKYMTCKEAMTKDPSKVRPSAEFNCNTLKDRNATDAAALKLACSEEIPDSSFKLLYPDCTGKVTAAEMYDLVGGECANLCSELCKTSTTRMPMPSKYKKSRAKLAQQGGQSEAISLETTFVSIVSFAFLLI